MKTANIPVFENIAVFV